MNCIRSEYHGFSPLIQTLNSTLIFPTEEFRLKKHGERYNYIEVGAIAQNMQLQGVALNIGMVLVGGFNNEGVKTILKLPPELEPSALLCFGNV
jgi:nitroreductase